MEFRDGGQRRPPSAECWSTGAEATIVTGRRKGALRGTPQSVRNDVPTFFMEPQVDPIEMDHPQGLVD